MKYTKFNGKTASAQQGAVLVIGLIMLLLMTIVGLASIRGSGMQELMAGNMRDRQISFQSAEAGLRIAEKIANAGAHAPTETDGLIVLKPDGSNADYWQTYPWTTGTANSKKTSLSLALESEKSRYVIEDINAAPPLGQLGNAVSVGDIPEALSVYRVTSRGVGMSSNSITILQSTYWRP